MRVVIGVAEVANIDLLAGVGEMEDRAGEMKSVIHLDCAGPIKADLLAAIDRCGEFDEALVD